jgi:hypothetical protein
MSDQPDNEPDMDPRSDKEICWEIERRMQAQMDQQRRLVERQARLEQRYGDYSRIPYYLLQPCRTKDCTGLADHMDRRCWRCSQRRARYGDERLRRLPLSYRDQRAYTKLGMAIVRKHIAHPVVIGSYNALLSELQYQASTTFWSWRHRSREADQVMRAMCMLRTPGQIHPARIIGALVGFMLLTKHSPRYPTDVEDNLLAEWLLSMQGARREGAEADTAAQAVQARARIAPAQTPATPRLQDRARQGREAQVRQAHLAA